MVLILREGLGWLSFLILLVGALVCGIYLTRVRWAAVLMGGFGLQAVWLGFGRLVAMLGHGIHGGFLTFASLAGLIGSAFLVAGAIGVLSEHARLQQARR